MRSINLTAKIFFVFLIIFVVEITAQENDTLAFRNSSAQDTSTYKLEKSPWGAVARSAILPGLGQIYNHSYWKAPIVWGFAGYFIYHWINYHNKYKDWQERYSATVAQKSPNNNFKYYRDFYRDNRDLFTIYLGLTYFLNLIDAYVDAHFFGFSIDEDEFTNSARFNLHINF